MKVLITGARGLLGGAVAREFADRHEVVALDRGALDVTSDDAVRSVIAAERPSVIVNCAAWNDVDGAEDEPARALRVNAFAVRSLVRAAAESEGDR